MLLRRISAALVGLVMACGPSLGAIVYRTDGAWGSGKGLPLTHAELDGNFYTVDSDKVDSSDLASTTAGKGASLVVFEGGSTIQDLAATDAGKGADLVANVPRVINAADYTTLALALAAAESRSLPLWLEPGETYSLSATLQATSGITIYGNGATLAPTSAIAALTIVPAATGVSTTLAADAQIGLASITVASATGFSVGDLITIKSDAAWHYDAAGFKGELHRIQAISGAVLSLDDQLMDNYDVPTETVTVTLLTGITPRIYDLNIEYSANSLCAGMQISNAVGGEMRNVSVLNAATQAVYLKNCYGFLVDHLYVRGSNQSSFGYGVSTYETFKVTVRNSSFHQCRRGVDFSGSFPSRKGVVESCFVDGHGLATGGSSLLSDGGSSGFGNHHTSEHTIFRNNIITGVRNGIIARGADNFVLNNQFIGDITLQIVSSTGANLVVDGNTYSANLRPGKTLDVVASDDDESKAPWFVTLSNVFDPTTGYWRITNNSADDIKNALVNITKTAGANGDTFVDGDVTTATDRITLTAHAFVDATEVHLTTTGTLPAGLALATNYYTKSIDANTIELYADAGLTSIVDITAAAGTGTHTITSTLHNVTIAGNTVRMLGSTATTTVNLIEAPGLGFSFIDSSIERNTVVEHTATYVPLDTGITVIPPTSGDGSLVVASGAKVGATAGWSVNPGSDRAGLALCPASQTGATLVVPLNLPIGSTLTSYTVRGQVESAGGAATLDAELRSLTVATADITDAAVTGGAITQVSVTADAQISATVTGLRTTVAAGVSYYLLLTATTAAATDFDITYVSVGLIR